MEYKDVEKLAGELQLRLAEADTKLDLLDQRMRDLDERADDMPEPDAEPVARQFKGFNGVQVVNDGGVTHIGLEKQRESVQILGSDGLLTFPVEVYEEGGDAGGEYSTCAFTYTVKDLDGNTLKKNASGDDATGMVPQKPRIEDTGYQAPASGAYGVAFYDGDTLVLWDVPEVPLGNDCPSEG
jgi:hypothetical protein